MSIDTSTMSEYTCTQCFNSMYLRHRLTDREIVCPYCERPRMKLFLTETSIEKASSIKDQIIEVEPIKTPIALPEPPIIEVAKEAPPMGANFPPKMEPVRAVASARVGSTKRKTWEDSHPRSCYCDRCKGWFTKGGFDTHKTVCIGIKPEKDGSLRCPGCYKCYSSAYFHSYHSKHCKKFAVLKASFPERWTPAGKLPQGEHEPVSMGGKEPETHTQRDGQLEEGEKVDG